MTTTPTISMQSVCGSVLLFGSAGEDTTIKFQSVTGLSLNVSNSFHKIISLSSRKSH